MNVNTRSHLLATYSKMNVNVENAKQRIGNWKQIDSRKTDECCISEEGKTTLEEKMLEAHDNTLLHVAGRLSNISRQYYVDLFGKTLQMTQKSKSMDEFFEKMESLHEEMEKEIESKYDNLREEEYFVSQNGTIEKLTKEKELELLHFAYESHKTLMRNSIEIWEKKEFLC
ncbi:MAG: hypothetical protein IJA07_06085 [Agathobacter sp.]|nr:hypothetical protein [Agathobacter sp.]